MNVKQVSFSANTNGNGLWSDVVSTVRVIRLEALVWPENQELGDDEFGELRVVFDINSWNTTENGLIYTDKGFIENLRSRLALMGFTDTELDDMTYSEAGMQGHDYVSMDIGVDFINGWRRLISSDIKFI